MIQLCIVYCGNINCLLCNLVWFDFFFLSIFRNSWIRYLNVCTTRALCQPCTSISQLSHTKTFAFFDSLRSHPTDNILMVQPMWLRYSQINTYIMTIICCGFFSCFFSYCCIVCNRISLIFSSCHCQSPRKKIFFRYYLSSAGCLYVSMYLCIYVC